jgi:hypothetical protein
VQLAETHSAGRGPWPRGAQPAGAVLAQPTATLPVAARVARGRGTGLARRWATARHRCTEMTGRWRLTGTETAARCDGDGRAWRGGGSGDRSARTPGAQTWPIRAEATLVRQLSAARAKRLGRDSEREAWSGGGRGEATLGGAECGALSGRGTVPTTL